MFFFGDADDVKVYDAFVQQCGAPKLMSLDDIVDGLRTQAPPGRGYGAFATVHDGFQLIMQHVNEQGYIWRPHWDTQQGQATSEGSECKMGVRYSSIFHALI